MFHAIILSIWFLIEPIRLYYGIAGNLYESVSHHVGIIIDFLSMFFYEGAKTLHVSSHDNISSGAYSNISCLRTTEL